MQELQISTTQSMYLIYIYIYTLGTSCMHIGHKPFQHDVMACTQLSGEEIRQLYTCTSAPLFTLVHYYDLLACEGGMYE